MSSRSCGRSVVEAFRGIPPDDITAHTNTQREEESWANRPHEDLVRAFRGLLWQKRLSYGEFAPNFPPATIIRQELNHKTGPGLVYDPQRKEFFTKLRDAWN